MENLNSLLPYIKLRFNIDHPDLEECYAYGYECAKAEIPEEENPYSIDTAEYEQWQEGWWAGFYGEEPLFSFGENEIKEESQEPISVGSAANDQTYHPLYTGFITSILRLSGALAATAVVGYQVIDLVA
ncbi:transmission trait enhancer LetE [Legionella gresilensis]|uniref:transmission trait enhancer LetE n=1 Tax=Legionella gresilensis TaxID=91823 RepID=UPI00104192C1|nr:transmission trait enhancer LetE [Legionella gresilensis]